MDLDSAVFFAGAGHFADVPAQTQQPEPFPHSRNRFAGRFHSRVERLPSSPIASSWPAPSTEGFSS